MTSKESPEFNDSLTIPYVTFLFSSVLQPNYGSSSPGQHFPAVRFDWPTSVRLPADSSYLPTLLHAVNSRHG